MLNSDFFLDAKSVSRLSSRGLCFESIKKQVDSNVDCSLELWRAQGLNIVKHKGYFYFDTKFISVEEAVFCIVDIETNGSKLDRHQIIEIAALKIKNGKIIDRFESLVHCDRINEHISNITGIRVEDTRDAPPLKDVLYSFKSFLGNAIFVAHDVKFDFMFISGSFTKVGLEPLLNRSLCSIALAERTIVSYRYALSYLNSFLHLHGDAVHHRAMSDVITTYELFKISIEKCKDSVNNVEDLIRFSKDAARLKRPKFDPLMPVISEEIEEQQTQKE